MATKTISLELDAYDRLKRAKRGSESFSEVVRRARFDPQPATGAALLGELSALYGSGGGPRNATFNYWQSEEEEETQETSPSHWDQP